MIGRLLLAGVAGGAIVFVMSGAQNAVLPAAEPRSLPAQAAILPVLKASIPRAGFYFFPGDALTRAMTAAERDAALADHGRRFREGPAGVIVYSAGGDDFAFGRRLATQFALSVIAALTASAILALGAGTATYGARVAVVCLTGVFAFVYLEPQYWNWYGFPASYTAARVAGGVVAWAAAGCAMAAIVGCSVKERG